MTMSALNIIIVENIIKSEHFSVYLSSIGAKLSDDNSYTRLLAHLISFALITNSPGESQMDVVEKFWSILAINELSGVDDLSQEHLILEVDSNDLFFFVNLNKTFQKPNDISFGKYIITKPNSKTAIRWAQIAVVGAMARVPCPNNVDLNWLLESSKVSNYLTRNEVCS